MKKILITGGMGYLGGQLSNYLINNGFKVIIGSSRKLVSIPKQLLDCKVIYIDLSCIDSLKAACDGVDSVVHLAGINASSSFESPKLAYEINTLGTSNLVKASIEKKVKYFLYFSTAHVYGSPLSGLINENSPTNAVHPYASSHKEAEDFLLENILSKRLNGSIFRLSNVIGAPLTKDANCWMLFANDASKQAITNKKITIKSNVKIERDFISMLNVCKISEFFLNEKPSNSFPVYNIGSGESINLYNFASLISKRCEFLFGYLPELIFSKSKTVKHLQYETNKISNQIEFSLSRNLSPSIDDMLIFCHSEFL